MRAEECWRRLRKDFPEICDEEFEYIFRKTINFDYGELFVSDRDLSSGEMAAIAENLKKRKNGKPVEYIFGSARFMGFDFKISEGIFIPKNTTEVLVDEILKVASDGFRIADIGCGAGVIAIVLAKMKTLKVFATDIDEEAVELTKKNARLLGASVETARSDLFEKLSGKFDIIASNPPYVEEEAKLPKEVLLQKGISLFSGADGLDCAKRIIRESSEYLKKGGFLFLEVGYGQAKKVRDVMTENGFGKIKVVNDLSGIPRVVRGKFAS